MLEKNTGEISVEKGLETCSVKQMCFESGGKSNVTEKFKLKPESNVKGYGVLKFFVPGSKHWDI